MSNERAVAEHYSIGSLEQAILEALARAGKDISHLDPVDLAPVDEFHIGGRQATIEFADQLDARSGMHLLDVGSGLGGASRFFAHEKGCRVTGIDLTEEYVATAASLSRRTGLDDVVSYEAGSALDLPFPLATFDAAYMLHVGMNIADKSKLFSEIHRVVKREGRFGIYDVMREGTGDLIFPVPWATQPQTSFVETSQVYIRLLLASGFEVLKTRSRREFAINFFRELRARMVESGPPLLGLHILMGSTAPQKIANMVEMLERGLIAPTEVIARRV